jgi:hypothetical protein
MHWSTVMYEAAERFDGGVRSFPPASDAMVARKYGYNPPNAEYQMLLFRKGTVPNTQRDQYTRPHCAGWLLPDADDIVCKPLIIAHSVMAMVWLLREMLPDDTLSNDDWSCITRATQSLAENGMVESPSAQRSAASLLPGSEKRPSSSAKTSSSKRARTEKAVETLFGSPQPVQQPGSEEQLVEEPRLVTTVTNNNRRSERERIKAYEAAMMDRSLDLGLVAPDKQAGHDERGAYASISPRDKEVISWLFKQQAVDGKQKKLDFYSAVPTPYLNACDFLSKARALGSPSSRAQAAHFLQVWRQNGTLFGGSGVATRYNTPLLLQQRALVTQSSQAQQLSSSADEAFCSAWKRCNAYDEVMKSVHIVYRWTQALLGQALANKVAQIKHNDRLLSNDKTNRFGRGFVQTEAINALLKLVNRNPTTKERESFRARLAKATKWYRIAEGLGWGVFLMMPEDVISNTWIENTIRAWGIDVFIGLVRKERPDVCLAVKQFDEWLGIEGIAGGEIKGKMKLSIEVNPQGTGYGVEEIEDSEADSDDEDENWDAEEANERVEIAQRQFRFKSASAISLRQTTLPELFKAVA